MRTGTRLHRVPYSIVLADAVMVIAVDVNEAVVDRLNRGSISDEEPLMLNLYRASGDFISDEVPYADAFIIACLPAAEGHASPAWNT